MSSKKSKHNKSFNKAGCVIMGNAGPDGKGEPSLLVPYNEGRFAQKGEYFVLPKGSVDKGEDVLDAAIRETTEETGIDIRKLLGEEAIAQLKAGKTVRHLKSEAYPGVTILKADPVPYRHDYLSRAGVTHRLALFRIEIDGIDLLAEHTDRKNHGHIKTNQLIGDHPERPKFPTFIQWMEQGYIPAGQPSYHPDRAPGVDKGIVPLHTVEWFKGLVQKYAPDGKVVVRDGTGKVDWETSRQHWQTFCKNMSPSDYKQISRSFHAIKSHIKEHGWVGADTDLLKFDEKDCPLFYYTEGARVVPTQQYIGKIFYDLEHNPDYACAFGGQCDAASQLSPQRSITHSQLAAIGPFVETYDYVNGLHKAIEQNGGKPLTWQQGECQPCEEKGPSKHIQSGNRVIQSLIDHRAVSVVRHGTEKLVAGALR